MAPAPKSKRQSDHTGRKRIIFFHPDLGIGGAERLIIDAAVGLQELGHKVTIFTSHCDPRHCFEEARDGTLDVRVRGNTVFPPTILNRLHILLAILRQSHLVLAIGFFSDELYGLSPDVFIVDQLSACVPMLRWLYPKRQRTLFYCHFPDQLLADRRDGGVKGLLKKIYRIPFDWFEGWSMGASDKIVVNSNFTKSVAGRVFPSLTTTFSVIYPCVDVPSEGEGKSRKEEILWDGRFKILLSINRFERKKDVGLAIRAYKALTPKERSGSRLVIAGGYDNRVAENVQYHQELEHLAEEEGLVAATAKTVPTALGTPDDVQVLFLLSIPGSFKNILLSNAKLLIYTPTNEHFGIVPVEAMQHGLPVLAANTGGPLETIIEGETGWLRSVRKVQEWTTVIRDVLQNTNSLAQMRESGPRRVKENFTRSIMAQKFDTEISSMWQKRQGSFIEGKEIFMIFGVAAAFIAALIATVMRHHFGPGPDRRVSDFARARRMQLGSEQAEKLFSMHREI